MYNRKFSVSANWYMGHVASAMKTVFQQKQVMMTVLFNNPTPNLLSGCSTSV